MIKLELPSNDPEEVFQMCIEIVKNKNLKERLIQITPDIIQASIDYEEKAICNVLHTIPAANDIRSIVSNTEMELVYTYRMVPKRVPGRKIYDQLISGAKNSLCPLCGQRVVATLDHYLPKSKFPKITVLPANLIPSCTDCNKLKDTHIPTNSEEELLHPYFDNVEGQKWMQARVIEKFPPVIDFFVECPQSWPLTLKNRVKNHFKLFKLNELYSIHAAEELSQIRNTLISCFNNGGAISLKNFLYRYSQDRAVYRVNAWQPTLYLALSQSEWFVNDGYKLIE